MFLDTIIIRSTLYRFLKFLFLFSFFFSLFTSCTPELKLATNFVKTHPEINLQLFTPDNLFKFNHKGEDIEGFNSLTDRQQDSALYASSKFLQYTNDSVFLENYMNSFIDELRALGFQVYLDHSVDSFLKEQPQSYIVNISQIQLDEYKFPIEDSEPFGDSILYESFQLNGLDASSWFELTKINTPNPKKTVLYSSFTSSDGFEGRFILNQFTMDFRYKYKIDSLKMKDIYEMATYTGKKNASYLFDFFMNRYIAFQLAKVDMESEIWLHYNRFNNTFIPTEEEQFEVINSK